MSSAGAISSERIVRPSRVFHRSAAYIRRFAIDVGILISTGAAGVSGVAGGRAGRRRPAAVRC